MDPTGLKDPFLSFHHGFNGPFFFLELSQLSPWFGSLRTQKTKTACDSAEVATDFL